MKNTFFIFLYFLSITTFAQTPNWSNSIAKILYANCTSCHRPGGIAPFSLTTYQNAYDYAESIEYAVSNGEMPPWTADPNYKHFAHERVLSSSDITAIQQWVANSAPSGDTCTAPPIPTYSSTSQLTSINLSLKMPNYTVSSNTDEYRNFVINSNLTQAGYANTIEIIPGNAAIVHHVLVFQDSTNTPISSTSVGGTGSLASKLLYGYAPGSQPYYTPPGTGLRLPANTRIILQIHYAPGSQGQLDSTRINFKISTNPQRAITVLPLLNHYTSLTNGPLYIPAGQTKTFNEQTSWSGNWTFLYAFPHMHLIGRSITSYATTNTPNDTIRFIKIPEWDFHWQDNFIFRNAIKVSNGATLRATAFYDNTTNNPDNPSSPPQNVSAGESTTDEMMGVFFAYMPYQAGDEYLIIDKRIIPQGATTFNSGQSVLLKTIEGVGYTYQWYKNGSIINGATAASYEANQSGSYTVSITLGPNNAVSDPVTVTVNTLPSISGDNDICSSSVATYSTTSIGTNYFWTVIGGTITSGQGTNTITVQWLNGTTGSVAVAVTP